MQQLVSSAPRRWLLALAAGALSVLGYAPYSWWPLPPLLLAMVFSLLPLLSVRQAAWFGFAFGLGLFGVGISWVHVSIDQFGGLPLPVSILLMLMLSAYLSLYTGLALAAARWLSRGEHKHLLWLAPCCWILCEFARGYLLTGFPWLAVGYSQLGSPLALLAPVVGVQGVGLAALLLAAAVAYLAVKPKLSLIPLAMIPLSLLAVSQMTWITANEQPLKVALVQGNIKQDLRWDPDQVWPTMLKYQDLSRPHYDSDLVIWPEAAVPEIEYLARDYLGDLDYASRWADTAVITGVVDYNFETKRFFNTLIVLGKQGDVASSGYYYGSNNRYRKHHLLPIGEFVPFGDLLRPLAPLFNLPMSSFSRGPMVQENLLANGLRVAAAICYEVAFPELLRSNVHADTDLLLTVSNDAWFGDSIGPHQHMEIAQMRALELGRPLLRATNNGITAAVDHLGREIARLPQFEDGVLTAEVQRVTGVTPFSRIGHAPLLVGLLLLLGATTLQRLKWLQRLRAQAARG